jgi:hypothetical protein
MSRFGRDHAQKDETQVTVVEYPTSAAVIVPRLTVAAAEPLTGLYRVAGEPQVPVTMTVALVIVVSHVIGWSP